MNKYQKEIEDQVKKTFTKTGYKSHENKPDVLGTCEGVRDRERISDRINRPSDSLVTNADLLLKESNHRGTNKPRPLSPSESIMNAVYQRISRQEETCPDQEQYET